MSRAHRDIPPYFAALEMDFEPARAWLEAWNSARPPAERILATAVLLRAVARAATLHPRFNGRYGGAGFEPSAAVNLGVAIAQRGGGLVAPAILDAGSLDLPTLMEQLRGLVDRARRGRLRSGEFGAATITVTALGDEGADLVYPIIHSPQVAMVGFGTPRPRPWVIAGSLVVRDVIGCTLAADHHVTDGRDGARFLAEIGRQLAAAGMQA
jgi:pyruvate dehydrogenase E2 component (dihydrolipoamide acetyltransferase)